MLRRLSDLMCVQMVEESIAGLVLASPHLSMLKGHRVIVRTDIAEYKQSHVALVSGGGSGHEPAHGGFVGTGMLSAAVCGDVFASPPPSAILAAIRRSDVTCWLQWQLIITVLRGLLVYFSLSKITQATG